MRANGHIASLLCAGHAYPHTAYGFDLFMISMQHSLASLSYPDLPRLPILLVGTVISISIE
jgi:hypothetical protein